VDQRRRGFERDGLFDLALEVPAVGANPATRSDAITLVPRLTQDVLLHTLDLARAVGADDRGGVRCFLIGCRPTRTR
jgi:hypothetical protein